VSREARWWGKSSKRSNENPDPSVRLFPLRLKLLPGTPHPTSNDCPATDLIFSLPTKMPVAAAPSFVSQPMRYCRWAARNYPARFYSVVLGAFALAVPVAIPVRRALGYQDHSPVPMTWPSMLPTWILDNSRYAGRL
jgi:hypothetical protein